MVRVVRATPVELENAVTALRDGELVAFPTETVYGLGANAQNPAAVRRIFELKERPADHPVIVHLDNPKYLHRWAREVPENAQKLAARFWPGPLTMVLPRSENVHDVVTGGQDTVAIRVPSHPMAQQLLTAFGGGIAAPSANRFGRVSPTRAEHVREEFGDAVRVVLDGGESQIGLESTIVSFDGEQVRLLRPGFITYSQLKDVVGDVIVGAGTVRAARSGHQGVALRADDADDHRARRRNRQTCRDAVRRRAPRGRARACGCRSRPIHRSPGSTPGGVPTPMRTICMRTCARSTRRAASRSSCRTCPATRNGPRSAIA